MTTAQIIRDLAARLERRVAAHGCGRASCSLCDDLDIGLDVLPARPANTQTRPVVIPGFSVVSRPEAAEERARAAQVAQEAVFGATLECY